MSIRVMTNVWQFSSAAGTDLLVLLALADIADDDGECWPSVGYVARKCRIDTRTTQRRIRSLEKLGEVVVIVGGGRTRTAGATPSNRYRITVHMPAEGEGGDLPEGGTGDRERVAPVPGGRVAHAPPNTPVLPVKEPSKTYAQCALDFEAVWSIYPRKVDRGRAFKAYTARRKAGVSPEDLLAATMNFASSVKTTDPRFVKYGSTFFGADEPFADFVHGIPEGASVGADAIQSKSTTNRQKVIALAHAIEAEQSNRMELNA